MAEAALILAAGRGTRMKSELAKVLHPLVGRPMIAHVVDAVRASGVDEITVVVGHQADRVRDTLRGEFPDLRFVTQDRRLGTGHAVMVAEPEVSGADRVLIVPGDAPLLRGETLRRLLAHHREREEAAVLLTANLANPYGYGRIVRASDGSVERIVEEADASEAERAITEVHSGVGCFQSDLLFRALRNIQTDNAQGEYYLVDVVPHFRDAGGVGAVMVADPAEILGINDRIQLANAGAILQRRLLENLMEAGVTVVDPTTTYVDAGVTVGPDTVLEPFTFLRGNTRVGSRCRIGPGAQIVDCQIEDDCTVGTSVLESSHLGRKVTVGPFNHLRPGTVLEEGVKVGNFAEIKQSRVGTGSKVPHHSYLGDAQIGRGVNIGAGVVTVNYDGREKHRTVLGDGAFIGCNANLIAPVEVGRNGYVAAGSTVNKNVPDEALAIARSRQENKAEWVRRRLARRPPTGDGAPPGGA